MDRESRIHDPVPQRDPRYTFPDEVTPDLDREMHYRITHSAKGQLAMIAVPGGSTVAVMIYAGEASMIHVLDTDGARLFAQQMLIAIGDME